MSNILSPLERQYLEFLSGAFFLSCPFDDPLTRHLSSGNSPETTVRIAEQSAEKAFKAAQEIIRIASGESSVKKAEGAYRQLAPTIESDVQQVHENSFRVQAFLEDAQAGPFLSRVAFTGYISSEAVYRNLCHGRRNQVRTNELIQPLFVSPQFTANKFISDFKVS